MRPDDLALLRTPGVPTVSPDGRIAVVAVGRPDLRADVERSQLWAVPTDGSAPARPLTSGARDTDPVFSPDGRWLAYRGADPGEPPQLHLLPTAGGAPRRLTEHPLGAGVPVWAPDSRRLAYVARVPRERPAGSPHVITALRFRQDGVGLLADRPRCVFVLDLPADGVEDLAALPAPRQLTDGTGEDADVTWSPDGTALAFVSARHGRADRDLVRDVYAVPAAGGQPRRLTAGRGECRFPAYDPADGTLYVTARPELGPDGRDVVARNRTLCRVGPGGRLQPVLDPDVHGRADGTPATVLSGGSAYVGVARRGAVELLRVPLDGRPAQPLVEGAFTVRGFAVAGGVVVATVAHDRSAGELIAVTPGRRRLITGFGRALGATGRLHRTRDRVVAAAGGAPVHGWAAVPEGDGPHPVLLALHDGPYRQDGWLLSEETQALVTAGYAVLRCNPRGAAGYGQAHGRALRGAWGGPDADDVLAFLDGVLGDRPSLDPERIGVLGHGYGGSLATLLLARTPRFAAAAVESALTDPAAFAGTSDIGWWFVEQHLGVDPDRLAAQSPLVAARAITTPTLVVHAEEDRRCPAEQGVRLYVELAQRGVPAELLLFPGRGRPLSPRQRLARLQHLLAWWDRWLAPAPEEHPGGADGPAGGAVRP